MLRRPPDTFEGEPPPNVERVNRLLIRVIIARVQKIDRVPVT